MQSSALEGQQGGAQEGGQLEGPTLLIEGEATALEASSLTTTPATTQTMSLTSTPPSSHRIRHTALPVRPAARLVLHSQAATIATVGTTLMGRPARDVPQIVQDALTAPHVASLSLGTI